VTASSRKNWQPVLHLEATLAGDLDVPCLTDALAASLAHHPRARSTMTRRWPPSWRVLEPTAAACRILLVRNMSRDTARRELLATHWDLYRDVGWRLVLLPDRHEATLLLVAHHALFDGRGALALLADIMHAYSGAQIGPEAQPPDARPGARSPAAGPVDHLASGDADWGPPDAVMEALDAETSRVVFTAGRQEATVNDVLVAATHLTCARWNERHQIRAGRIGVTVPVEAWPARVPRRVGNHTLQAATVTTPDDRADAARLLGVVHAQTRQAKVDGAGEAALRVSRVPLPVGLLRAAFAAAEPFVRPRVVLTTRVSNVGRVDEDPYVNAGFGLVNLWFSPPARSPQHVTVGAVTVDDRLHLAVRRDGRAFDESDAREFLALLVAALWEVAAARLHDPFDASLTTPDVDEPA
jgi:NRPS condensation-like uncharacterized protein